MLECGFSPTRNFPYMDRIEDSFVIRENSGQRKPEFWQILLSAESFFVKLQNCNRQIY